MADVKGLLSDTDFQKLDPATQKSTLGKLDPEFSSLTDDQFNQFKSKATPKSGTQVPSWMTQKLPKRKTVPPVFDSNRTGGGEPGYVDPFDAYGTALGVMGGGELAVAGGKALASGAIKQFLKSSIPRLVAGAVSGMAAKKGAEFIGASPGVADAAGVAGGVAGMYGEGKIGAFLRSIPEDVAKGSWLNFAKWLAEKAKTDETAARLLPEAKAAAERLKTQSGTQPDTQSPTVAQYGAPAPKAPGPINRTSLPEGVNPPAAQPSRRPVAPKTPAPSTDLSRNPISPSPRVPSEDELTFDRAPRTKASPKTAPPGSAAPVDASKVKEAAEMVRSLGATAESLQSAPQSQWDAIGKQLGHPVDENFKKAVIEEVSEKPPAPKPSPKADLPSGPKTSKPTPGGAKVESTMTPEARAARADEHSTSLAKALRKLPSPDSIPSATNDAAWKVLEDQTGTEATPKVRQAAIDKAKKLWSESAADLQKRRSAHFNQQP